MNVKSLRNNLLINNIVKTILDNDDFFNSCKNSIEQIYEDKKIDSKDIPVILNLLVNTYNNYSTLNLDRKDIKEVFILLFIELITKLDLTKDIDLELVISLLSPQIDLLLISINSNITAKNIEKLCCCCKPNKEESP